MDRFLAAKCSTKNHSVAERGKRGESEALAFLPFTQKIFRQPIPENFWLYQHFFADAPMIFFLSKILVYLMSMTI